MNETRKLKEEILFDY